MIHNKKLNLLLLFVVLINGCEKKDHTPAQFQMEANVLEAFQNNGQSEQEFFLPEEKQNDTVEEQVAESSMVPYEHGIAINYAGKSLTEFLLDFFEGNVYVLFDEPLDVNYRQIHFAVHYIGEFWNGTRIFDTAVGYEIIAEDAFVPYLFVRAYKFLDMSNSIIIDFSNGYPGIYGFNFMYSYPNPLSPYTPGLSIDTYFDNGTRIADSFNIYWNEENMVFEMIKQGHPLWYPGL